MIVATAPKSFEYLVLAGGVDDGKKAPPPIPADRIRGLMKACLNRLAKTGLRRFDVDAWMDVDGFDVFSASMLDLIEGGRLQRIQLRLRIVNPSDSTLVSLSILARGLRDATGTAANWEIQLYADGSTDRRGLLSQGSAVRRLFQEILWVHTPSRLELDNVGFTRDTVEQVFQALAVGPPASTDAADSTRRCFQQWQLVKGGGVKEAFVLPHVRITGDRLLQGECYTKLMDYLPRLKVAALDVCSDLFRVRGSEDQQSIEQRIMNALRPNLWIETIRFAWEGSPENNRYRRKLRGLEPRRSKQFDDFVESVGRRNRNLQLLVDDSVKSKPRVFVVPVWVKLIAQAGGHNIGASTVFVFLRSPAVLAWFKNTRTNTLGKRRSSSQDIS